MASKKAPDWEPLSACGHIAKIQKGVQWQSQSVSNVSYGCYGGVVLIFQSLISHDVDATFSLSSARLTGLHSFLWWHSALYNNKVHIIFFSHSVQLEDFVSDFLVKVAKVLLFFLCSV
jgi:hypothetical protein